MYLQSNWPFVVLLSLFCTIGIKSQALAQVSGPAELNFPAQRLDKFILPKLNNDLLLQEELSQRRKGRAPRFAKAVSVSIQPGTHGRWDSQGGLSVWRFRVQSPGALSLNLGFTQYQMPAGGKLFIYNVTQDRITGPFTPADNESHNELWTPVFEGDELVIEIQVPSRRKRALEIELGFINHDFLGFGQSNSGSCNLDVACTDADGWGIVDPFRDVTRSVGLYSIEGTLLCTGFLINNTLENCAPYFMTANHCEVDKDNASTVVVYWNYENSTCREPGTPESGGAGDGKLDDFNTGTTWLAGWSNSDFCLLELDDPLKESSRLFFAGWSARPEIPEGSTATIHHPITDEKRLAYSEAELHLGFWGSGQAVSDGNHLIVPRWNVGTTQGGSSGAPLFNSQARVVGQLHGGDAACGNEKYDSFGRFFSSWEGGGTPDSRLKDWLDPSNSGKLELGGRNHDGCEFFIEAIIIQGRVCAGGVDTIQLRNGIGFGDAPDFTFNTTDPGVTFDLVSVGNPTFYVVRTSPDVPEGKYIIDGMATGAGKSINFDMLLNVVDAIPQTSQLVDPPSGAENLGIQIRLRWDAQDAAEYYNMQLSLDPGFTTVALEQSGIGENSFAVSELLTNTTYYWRIQAVNSCGTAEWSAFSAFSTAQVDCEEVTSTDGTIDISSTTVGAIVSEIPITASGTISSVEIINLNIEHQWVGDLSIVLQGPDGDEVILLDRAGFPANIYGCDGSGLLLSFNQNTGKEHDILERSCGSSTPSLQGVFVPVGDLTDFSGKEASGVWKLFIKDNAADDGGRFIEWTLKVCTQKPSPPFLTTLLYELPECINESFEADFKVGNGFNGPKVNLSVEDLPEGASANFSKNPAAPGEIVTLSIENLTIAGRDTINLKGDDQNISQQIAYELQLDSIPYPTPLIEPFQASSISGKPEFFWEFVPFAKSYFLEVATDPDFDQIVYAAKIEDNNHIPPKFEQEGLFYWRLIAVNACGESISDTRSFTFTLTGTSNLEEGQNVHLYPNPFTDLVNLRFEEPLAFPVQVRLLDMSGRHLESYEIGVGTTHQTLALDRLSNGVYFVEMSYKGQRYVQKLIKGGY